MQIYRIDEAQARVAERTLRRDLLVHRAPSGGWLLSRRSAEYLDRGGRRRPRGARLPLAEMTPVEPSEQHWREAGTRLIHGWAAAVTDPLPAAVEDEVRLYLYANPDQRVEYMGRGRGATRDPSALGNQHTLSVDVAGGRRHYHLRALTASRGEDARLQAMRDTMSDFHSWLNDPEAKLVLSLGGGGFRMFAATTILKVLERLLDGDRGHVAEVWGSSGGAFVGNAFSAGFDLAVLDELGYDLYHGRDPKLVNGSSMSLLRMYLQEVVGDLRKRRTEPVVAYWLRTLDAKQPPSARRHPLLPFFAVASNTRHKGLTALTEPANIPDYCRDILFPCERSAAVAASTAVPFLLRAQRGISAQAQGDTWIDGSINDENPILLPFIKWSRERELAPTRARERLKILLVDLNLRSSEAPILRTLRELPVIGKYTMVYQAARLVDMLLDSRMHATLQMLTENPRVSVRCLKLELGRLSFKNPSDIASVIHRGRQREAWQLTTYKRGL